MELSSGEEEEVRWAGGGCLDAPIVPPLPECTIRKATAAALVLEAESIGEDALCFIFRLQRFTVGYGCLLGR